MPSDFGAGEDDPVADVVVAADAGAGMLAGEEVGLEPNKEGGDDDNELSSVVVVEEEVMLMNCERVRNVPFLSNKATKKILLIDRSKWRVPFQSKDFSMMFANNSCQKGNVAYLKSVLL